MPEEELILSGEPIRKGRKFPLPDSPEFDIIKLKVERGDDYLILGACK